MVKVLKKLYGYGKTLAKHLWDVNKGYIARKGFQKAKQILSDRIPQPYKEISIPIMNKLGQYGQRYIQNQFGPDLLSSGVRRNIQGNSNLVRADIKPDTRLYGRIVKNR